MEMDIARAYGYGVKNNVVAEASGGKLKM